MNIGSKPHDLPIKNNPFAFGPAQLAKLYDPKNLSALRDMGGLRGLLIGLRTQENKGLSPHESTFHKAVNMQDVMVALEQQEWPRKFDALEEDTPESLKRASLATTSSTRPNYRTMSELRRTFSIISHSVIHKFEDRRRVFGVNQIPPRIPKTLLQLMWSVLQDQVLVCASYI
jgi:P-type Ca2+ transporter type 2C